jgi:hypothetical protein
MMAAVTAAAVTTMDPDQAPAAEITSTNRNSLSSRRRPGSLARDQIFA